MTIIQPPTRLSEKELVRLLEQPGTEYDGHQVVEKPMGLRAGEVELRIAHLLLTTVDEKPGVRVFSQSVGYRCYRDEPAKFRRPDVSVVRAERLAGIDPDTGFLPFPADLVVEVLSPNDLAYDVAATVEEYLANGFGLIWIVHPNTKTVTVRRADGSVSLLHEADELSGEAAMPTFRCRVSEIFARPA